MKKEMLINVLQPEECRIAILEDGVLEELYVERTSHESYVGNIYKGRIVNIEPSIQAAFVDFGVGRNGFLHVSDVEPAYYKHLEQHPSRRDGNGNGRGRGGRDRDRGGDRDRDRGRGRGGDRGRGGRGRSQERPGEARARSRELEMLEEDERELARLDQEEMSPPAAEEPPPLPVEESTPPPEDVVEFERSTVEEVEAPEPPAVEEPAAEEPAERPAPRGRGRSRESADAGKETKRSRGGSRRRTPPPEEPAAEAPDGPAEEAPPPEPEGDDETPRPRLMDSAERRTDEGDDEIRDEDLFFPKSEAEPPRPQVERAPEPEQEPLDDLEPYTFDSPPTPPRREFIEDLEEDDDSAPISFSTREEPDDDLGFEDIPPPPSRDEPRFDDEREASDIADSRMGDFDDDFGEEARPRGRGGRDRDRGDRGGRDRRPRRMGGRPGTGRPKPLIQDIFKRGQEVLVQVIKEGIGTKGPTLSTYISIAGRYLVLMPGLQRVGVSRKIIDEEERRRLRTMMDELQPPKGLGFVIRTSAQDRTKKELHRDLAYLSRLWQVVVRRIRKQKGPGEIYQESDMITRTIRDIFTSEIESIWVDESAAFEHAQEFLQVVMPRYANRIKHYQETEPIFHKHKIEDEIARIQQKKVPLPNGGSIVIEQTEALVAIDVNSGNFRADGNNAEETAYQMNLQAAKEIARQLRLRDLGGVIVNDFIDMREEKHRRGVERAVRDAVKRDRARTKILRMSQFGIIEMTRQRIRPSLKRSVYEECGHCHGTGSVKTTESMSLEVMRLLQLAAHREHVYRVNVRVTEEVAAYLLNRKRKEISKLEETGELGVEVTGVQGAPPEMLEFVCSDNNGNEVKFLPYEEERPSRRR